jgi:ATP-binding cassette subfamily C protein CydD
VPQRPHLFFGSVADNIRLARPAATDAEVISAAEAAGAAAFIRHLPNGYDTPIGEGGARLSGGEQQRLAIARAYLKDAPILILDEPTSHLDVANEALVQAALAELLRGKTALIISHRLSLAYQADEVIVLREGCIFAAGSGAQLAAKEDGPYRQLSARDEVSSS